MFDWRGLSIILTTSAGWRETHVMLPSEATWMVDSVPNNLLMTWITSVICNALRISWLPADIQNPTLRVYFMAIGSGFCGKTWRVNRHPVFPAPPDQTMAGGFVSAG